MALTEITREAVLETLAEYQGRGREGFLSHYGYREARKYLLVYEGESFDSKAVVGVAHKFSNGVPLSSKDFSGGEQHAVRVLQRLGFEVRSSRNPPWAWDELVLACDLVVDNGWKDLHPPDSRVMELSDILQRLPIHPLAERGAKFRNPNGVGRKTADIATRHPAYKGKLTNGGALDDKVVKAFIDAPEHMKATAKLIRAGVASGSLIDLPPVEDPDDEEISAPEGRLLLRRHLVRERDKKLRARKIAHARKTGGELACEVCGFSFERTYGPRGANYIECHHVVPLHASGETKTKLDDLALLCANCHRIIHRSAPWPTPIELSALIAEHAVKQTPNL